MNIIQQINNRMTSDGMLYQISHEDYNQLLNDYNYDNQRSPIHPMHQFYIDNYGRNFYCEKYIECSYNVNYVY